mmetsp:Transcript_40177/g.59587  ORF Transcript_40177/g.59587 Transcript_40177/m.59587 type:complete len:80 (+) Transcript_40177:2109-2348(+)
MLQGKKQKEPTESRQVQSLVATSACKDGIQAAISMGFYQSGSPNQGGDMRMAAEGRIVPGYSSSSLVESDERRRSREEA